MRTGKFAFFYTVAFLAVYAIVNVPIFVCVPFEKLNFADFWISWGFMFGLNTLVALALVLGLKRKNPNDISVTPYALFAGGNVVYIVLGLIFCLVKPAPYIVGMVDAIVAVIYLLLVWRLVLVIRTIRANDQTKRRQVAYIRNMTALVDSYVSLAADPDTADVLKKLASDFRFSDPVSPPSLAQREADLMSKVAELEDIVKSGSEAEILKDVNDIKRDLKVRNTMCANLK